MTNETAQEFAQKWIDSWNNHDLDVIMEHYSEGVEFYSPFIPQLKFNDTGVITNKEELRKYFKIGLDAYPDLHFVLHNYYTGINTVVLHYNSVKGRVAAEVFELDESGKAVKVYCNYSG
ncbi:MAG TPA: nuclear transport factor 2 family protein [Patescibacteria group bacterium]|nr:nuclear transport factor 2 family protein [Patescibacteria group bacterium]